MQHVLRRSLWLPKSRDEVFAFFGDASNLERITPPELHFRILSPLPIAMQQGAEIRYRLALYGIGFGWTTEVTCWEPGLRFVDVQRRGPYRRWEHTHRFEDLGSGTEMTDEVVYELPLPPFGDLVHRFVRRQLDRIFDFRTAAVRSAFRGENVSG